MLAFLRRVGPTLLVGPLMFLTACATNTEPVSANFTGSWSPPRNLVEIYRRNGDGTTKVVFRGDTIEVTRVGRTEPYILTRDTRQSTLAGEEGWSGSIMLSTGESATYRISCPVPTGTQMQCKGGMTTGQKSWSNPLPLVRNANR